MHVIIFMEANKEEMLVLKWYLLTLDIFKFLFANVYTSHESQTKYCKTSLQKRFLFLLNLA